MGARLLNELKVENVMWIRVKVPIASFGIPFTREFIETYPFPTPATIYGMLLSYIGETDRTVYVGSRFGIIVTQIGVPSLILRKIRRVKSSDLNDAKNSKPEIWTLFTGIEFVVALSSECELASKVLGTSMNPTVTTRFGGLSCGESHNLIDELSILGQADVMPMLTSNQSYILQPMESGEWSVPVWVDHVGTQNTIWHRASYCPLSNVSEVALFEVSMPHRV